MTSIAYYEADIQEFLLANEDAVLGALAMKHGFALEHQQKHAWQGQIQVLRRFLPKSITGRIYFEFSIPRMGKRVDVIVITGGVVFVIEFKVGARNFDRYAIEQVHDYSLDLKNFHRGSHGLKIIPILISTAANSQLDLKITWAPDQVAKPLCISPQELSSTIQLVVNQCQSLDIDFQAWSRSGYMPTPTIV